jgi:hypothetical protein
MIVSAVLQDVPFQFLNTEMLIKNNDDWDTAPMDLGRSHQLGGPTTHRRHSHMQ